MKYTRPFTIINIEDNSSRHFTSFEECTLPKFIVEEMLKTGEPDYFLHCKAFFDDSM